MLDFWKNLFNKSGSNESFDSSNMENIKFVLLIDGIKVGYLDLIKNIWVFNYTDEFKKQNKYHRLVGFPDLNKTYKSEVLWPFFKLRIPGLGQPMVQEVIEKENINHNSELELLVRFGERSSSNPFILKVLYKTN